MLNNEIRLKKTVRGPQKYQDSIEQVSDKEGHYDLDGVSLSPSTGVVVAGSDKPIVNKPVAKNFSSLSDKSLHQVETEADNISIKLKTRNTPSEDGIIDKTERLSSAKANSLMDPYLEFEKAGD